MSEHRMIRVTGKGLLRLRPDTTQIGINLSDLCPDYGGALRRSAEDTDRLKSALEPFGFAREDLKTVNFHVDAEYEGYQEEGVYKQRFVGSRFQHALRVSFPSDNDRLDKVLRALAGSGVSPEIGLSYTVKDTEAAKNALLSKAVTDAAEKASVLARAAGVELGEIETIDYSRAQIDFVARPMNRMMKAEEMDMAAGAMYAPDIQPDDISVEDTVTVTWRIE